METELARWGNSLAVRIPKDALKRADLREGDSLQLTTTKIGEIKLCAKRKRKSLKELLDGITPENLQEESDWGKLAGKEVW